MRRFTFVILVVMGALFRVTSLVVAGDEACDSGNCMSTRVINQWACHTCDSTSYENRCSNNTAKTCNSCTDCTSDPYCATDGSSVKCVKTCTDTLEGTCQKLSDTTFTCNATGPGACAWVGDMENCYYTGASCSGSTETPVLGCCGPGDGTTPKGCGDTCSKGTECSSGYCNGVCRNVNCPDEGSCTCPTPPSYTRSVVGLA